MRKFLCFAIALVFMLTPCVSAMNFTDVPKNEWYYEDVKGAYETGLINGKTKTEYKPNDYLTYAEAVKLAACMHQLHTTGKVTLTNGSPVWYSTYVEYCKNNNILNGKYEYNYNAKATRSGYMTIFANALPNEAMKQINSVADNSIPDVPSSKSYAPYVYKLYRAGILQGVDEKHNCNPDSNIKRSEVAAIITRMMNEDKRITFSMAEASDTKDNYVDELPKPDTGNSDNPDTGTSENKPVHTHSYTEKVTKPTCTEKGYTTFTCSGCGDSYKDKFVDATGHNYSKQVVAPTTTAQGYTLYTCACGHSYKDNYVPKLEESKPEDKPTQKPNDSDFENTGGKPTSEDGRSGLVAGEIAVNKQGLTTPRLDKNLGYSDNLAVLNGYVGNTYGSRRFFGDGISINDEEDGRCARIVQDGDRWGVNVFQWRKSYDSDIGTNTELNMVLEAFYFICGDREVAYALWSWIDAVSINGKANSNNFGFKDVKSTANGGIIEMNGIQIEVDFSGTGKTYYFG